MEQIRIDLIPGGVTPNAHASQYDIGRVIRFKLYNGGNPYTLAGTETVTIDITKPDGVEETITLTNTSSDYVDFITEDGLLNQAGLYECEFRITDGGDDIGTQNFNLRAEADAKGAIIIMEAQGNPAHFETDLAGALVSCIVDISYNASGYKSALVLNTSNTPATNETPYLFRPSFANGYGYETLIGGTCGVNQLVDIDLTKLNAENCSLSVSGDKIVMSNLTADSINRFGLTSGIPNNSKKALVRGTVKPSATMDILLWNGTNWGNGITVNANESYSFEYIYSTSISSTITDAPFGCMISGDTTGITVEWTELNIIDLTQMFGSTIADYVYTLESGTSGAGISWLKNNGFFGADYYPYNAGGLLSVKTSKKINTEKNLARPDYSGGASATTSGVTFTNNNGVVNVSATLSTGESYYNFYANSDGQRLQIKAGTYTVSCAETTASCTIPFRVVGVDAYLLNNNTHSVTFTATEDTEMFAYIRVLSGTSNINLDLHFQIEFGSTATAYEPYVSHEYPLDDIELRGILKLDGNNKLYYDGDTYESNGSVTRKYAIEDLSLIQNSIEYNAALGAWIVYQLTPAKYAGWNGVPNVFDITGKTPTYYGDENRGDNKITTDSAGHIIIGNNSSVDKPNYLVVFERATPTTETADPFTNPMIVDGNGTEEFVDGRAVQMPVGHSTIYGEDMKARFTDFGVTVYGGEYNLTTGVLTSTKNADGTDKNPPETFQLTPVYIPVRNGDNYITDNTNGDAHVKFIKKA